MADQPEQDQEVPIPAPDSVNPLFPGAVRYHWRQQFDEEKMAKSHDDMIHWIKNKMAFKAKQDNNHVEQTVTQEVNGTQYSFGLTAESGFFKIVISPAADYTKEEVPLVLVFSFRDLYLLGFFHGSTWYLFDDADLEGSGHLAHPDAYKWLGFKGSYKNSHFIDVDLSNYHLYLSYDTLVHYPSRSRDEVMVAVFRYLVFIPEPCRFPEWHNRVQYILKNLLTKKTKNKFRIWFQDWSTILYARKHVEGPTGLLPNQVTTSPALRALCRQYMEVWRCAGHRQTSFD